MFVTAIIAAGGRGQRLGGTIPKQLLAIGGRSMLERSVALFVSHPSISEVIVALPPELAADPPPYLRAAPQRVKIVAGGVRRQDSVLNAFEASNTDADVVVIHDAARPFASHALIDATIRAAAETGAAVAALASKDTVKVGGSQRLVEETLPRDAIYLAQTPQAFRREVLRDALALAATGVDVTDEATLAERAGHPVRLIDGEATNIKITTAEDLPIADLIARGGHVQAPLAPAAAMRVGTGYDLHRLVAGRRLILGGVEIPSPTGALGHSDADVVCHAITDAVLGAAGLGDIGRHFPDSDPQWKNASSLDLLGRAAALLDEAGYAVRNVDATVILEAPKIKDVIDQMRARIAAALNVDPSVVSVKGKTNEGVDAVGRGEAIAAHAVAIIELKPEA